MELENYPRWDTIVSPQKNFLARSFLTIHLAFNAFGCNYNEEKLLAMAHSMVEEGLVEAGYNSIIFDDCFTKKERGEDGELLEGIIKL
jgi:alpha-galactosidase